MKSGQSKSRVFASLCVVGLTLGLGLVSAGADPGNGKGTPPIDPGNSGVSEPNEQAVAHSQGNAGTTGVVSEPQPISTADDNGVGANTPGPYTSTRDGSPSANGLGEGAAVGRPCAGCVGRADNKNPRGQLPGPQDANAGYECDTNNGIAHGNPAHTGCTQALAEPEEPVVERSVQAEADQVKVLGVKQTRSLARTGGETVPLTLSGVMLTAVGLLVVAFAEWLRRPVGAHAVGRHR